MKLATHAEISRLIQETPDRTDKLVKLGMPRERGRQYNITRVVHWLIDFYRGRNAEEKANRYLWSLEEIAQLLNREPRTITKMAKERGLPRAGRGRYDIRQVFPWFTHDLERQLQLAKAGGEDATAARARLARAQADAKELENARHRGEAVNIDDFTAIVAEGIGITAQRMRTLKKQLPNVLIGLDTTNEMEAAIGTQVDDILTNLTTVPDNIRSLAEARRRSAAAGVGAVQASAQSQHRRSRKRASHTQPKKRRK